MANGRDDGYGVDGLRCSRIEVLQEAAPFRDHSFHDVLSGGT